jgi:hypothetical protein
MSKILVASEGTGSWYEELSVVSSYSEGAYEDKIKQYSETLFTEYYTIRFKAKVKAGSITKIPDLALISKDYTTWWVVEVELAGHSVSHVVEQVEVFRTGSYNAVSLVKYIRQVFTEEIPSVVLDDQKLERLITDVPPSILVIVDEPTEEWRSALRQVGAYLCDLQVFKNTERNEAYKLGGDYPSIFLSSTHLKFHKYARNTLELISGEELIKPLPSGAEVVLTYKGKTSKWSVDLVDGKTYIKCLGQICPLHIGNDYVLKYDQSGRFSIIDS